VILISKAALCLFNLSFSFSLLIKPIHQPAHDSSDYRTATSAADSKRRKIQLDIFFLACPWVSFFYRQLSKNPF